MSTCFIAILANIALLLPVFTWNTVLSHPIDNENKLNATDCPRIVSREEWKARKPKDFQYLETTPTPYVVVHHGGIRNYCYEQDKCSSIVRSYQNLHMDTNGWFDIGYNFVIGEDGNVYAGRGWDRVGAHAPGYNFQSIGICIIGDFTDFLPNEAALNALNSLIECGVSLRKISEEYNVIGHRQARNTECPGESFFNQYVKKMARWTSHPIPVYSQNSTSSNTSSGAPKLVTTTPENGIFMRHYKTYETLPTLVEI